MAVAPRGVGVMAVVEKEDDRLGECWGRPRYPGKQAGVNVAT